ncbi:hypothetical protein G4B88_016076 [Cannabis sativa]|uniref:Uncharacterized protein n=1 Tax=Cannabis sativa TaxID=3483 RepID=A0A7J6EY21_CANSA|nr:hypothetical protein G4B88_016076 [Cannabis sativa]
MLLKHLLSIHLRSSMSSLEEPLGFDKLPIMSTIDRMQRFSSGACRQRPWIGMLLIAWFTLAFLAQININFICLLEEYEGSAREAFPWVRHTRDFSQGDTVNWRTSSLGKNPKIFGNGCDSWYTPYH